MNLDLVNNISNSLKNGNFIQSFAKELQNYLANSIIEKGETQLLNPTFDKNRLTTKYRDEMNIRRNGILNEYAKQTCDKGEMYYIYSKNSKMEEGYNLCICEERKSHEIIEESKDNLPYEAQIGSVLRKKENRYILDEEATKEIAQAINNMRDEILEKQKEYLESKRIEGHTYELAEKYEDRALLFDITNNDSEGIEEIDFPKELLEDSSEGDLFEYINGEYKNVSA